MAHFAQLDENNRVVTVIVVHNNELLVDGVEQEEKGIAFCKSLYGATTIWKQTSYSNSFRKNFAGTNYSYDAQRDAFIPPKPFPSWVLDEETAQWQAPTGPAPIDRAYKWDEATISWVAVESE